MSRTKKFIYTALLISPLILGATVEPVQNVVASQAHASAFLSGKQGVRYWQRHHDSHYWINRTARFARQRAMYRYPAINWNFRSMGGYYAGHGYYTKKGLLYRGTDLAHINKRGIRQFRKLGIHQVIDLRSNNYEGGKDPQEGHKRNALNVRYYHDQVMTQAGKRREAPAKAKYGEIVKYGKPFTTWYAPRHAYHQVFMQLLHTKHGTYAHCIDGRDRTGLVDVLVLSALGVDKYTIYNDFMLTNYYKSNHPYQYEADQLGTFYRTVHRYYGSMNNYLHKGVGLNNRQIHQLRRMYLIKGRR